MTVRIDPRNPYDDGPAWPVTEVAARLTAADGTRREGVTGADGTATFGELPCGSTLVAFPGTDRLHGTRITLPATDPLTGEAAYHVLFHAKPKSESSGPRSPREAAAAVDRAPGSLASTGADAFTAGVLGAVLLLLSAIPLLQRRRKDDNA